MQIEKLQDIRKIIQDMEDIILDRNITNVEYKSQCLDSKKRQLKTTIKEL